MYWNLKHPAARQGARPAWMDGSDNSLAHLTRQLRAGFIAELGSALPAHRIDLALHEAGAQAMQTAHPELWLPELAKEKVSQSRTWHARQQRILGRNSFSFAA